RVEHVIRGRTTKDTLTNRSNDLTGVHDGLHGQTLFGAAVVDHNDRILSNVHETTGQVTRVRGLQCSISKTLTSTVRGVEVLKNVEAFLEVRGDRRFNDRAVWTSHKATHTSQLLHLRW